MNVKLYIRNVLVGLDQFANSVLGGSPDECISSRLARLGRTSRLWAWCRDRVDDLFGKGHCEASEKQDKNIDPPTWR